MDKVYIDGYYGEYEVYADGRVYSYKTKRFLKQSKNRGGYLGLSLCKNGIVEQCMVHRLVATHFISNPENKPAVNHKNGIKTDNRVSNLEWCSHSENMLHSTHVLNHPKPPMPFLNKFGYDHNRSIPVKVIIDGKLREFGSGLEFQRETGLDHSSISYARNKKLVNGIKEYKFTSGRMKGIVLLSNN